MKQKVGVVIIDNLSKVQEAIGKDVNELRKSITFCKWLLLKYHDTNKEIDVDEEYRKFSSINHNKLNDLLKKS